MSKPNEFYLNNTGNNSRRATFTRNTTQGSSEITITPAKRTMQGILAILISDLLRKKNFTNNKL